MDVVNEILQKAARESEKFKPITVEKHLDVELDLGNLLAFDVNDIDQVKLRSKKDVYLKDLTRDNTQLLLNKVWELPTSRVDEAIVAQLPKPLYILPRALPVPKPKEPTKWEKFAKEKGIVKTKKAKLLWDEVLKKWIPRFGYKRAEAEEQKDWAIAVPGNVDPNTDMFAKKKRIKQEKVAKNELQRMRNIAVAKKIKIPRTGMLPAEKMSTKDLHKAATIAKFSTASGGKFQDSLPKEKPARDIKSMLPVAPPPKKKKTVVTPADEKKSNIHIIDRILNAKPQINMEAAVNRELHYQDRMRSEEKKNEKPRAGRGGGRGGGSKKRKGGFAAANAKKGKGGKPGGHVKGKTGGAGRKRR